MQNALNNNVNSTHNEPSRIVISTRGGPKINVSTMQTGAEGTEFIFRESAKDTCTIPMLS